jgi:hypothetical protein
MGLKTKRQINGSLANKARQSLLAMESLLPRNRTIKKKGKLFKSSFFHSTYSRNVFNFDVMLLQLKLNIALTLGITPKHLQNVTYRTYHDRDTISVRIL